MFTTVQLQNAAIILGLYKLQYWASSKYLPQTVLFAGRIVKRKDRH